MVVYILLFFRRTAGLGCFRFLLADAVHASARIDVVVHRPVGALPAVGERAGDFFKAGIEGEVMADRVLGCGCQRVLMFRKEGRQI